MSGARKWIFNLPVIQEVTNDSKVQDFFSRPNEQLFIIHPKDTTPQLPPTWNATSVVSFTSFQDMEMYFQNPNTLAPPAGSGILYDPEVWANTPENEQNDPIGFTKKAADLAHSHNCFLIATPAINLMNKLDPTAASQGVGIFDSAINSNFAGKFAAALEPEKGDILELQAQGLEAGTSQKFDTFVQNAATQARAVHANLPILVGISTNPTGQMQTSDSILRAIGAAEGVSGVEGFWFNDPANSQYCPSCTGPYPQLVKNVLDSLQEFPSTSTPSIPMPSGRPSPAMPSITSGAGPSYQAPNNPLTAFVTLAALSVLTFPHLRNSARKVADLVADLIKTGCEYMALSEGTPETSILETCPTTLAATNGPTLPLSREIPPKRTQACASQSHSIAKSSNRNHHASPSR